MWRRHHAHMPVGVVDVGSNTVRLLLASGGQPVLSLRETLGLGECVERLGLIPEAKLDEVAEVVASFVDAAWSKGANQLEVLITSPGRQASNGAQLLAVIEAAADAPVRVLSADEEGRLAFAGAVASVGWPSGRRVAVVDVGGGSAQVVVGSRRGGAAWLRSIDLGSRRLTSRLLSADPPGFEALARARSEVEHLLGDIDPPEPRAVLAVGGSARALRRIVGSRLGAGELAEVTSILAQTSTADLTAHYDVNPQRAATLAGGAVILAALQQRLGAPMKVVRAGLRDGALLQLEARREAA
jgi:exopolyphosphatase / guanosine-5'-triphosphate,3'-diphosphate pyrophosphatase